MKVAGRKVILVRFHEPIHLPGVGELGNVLPNQTKKLELEMYLTEFENLVVSVKTPTGTHQMFFGSAQIKGSVLEPLPKATSVKK